MKRAVIGGFLGLIGTLGDIGVFIMVSNNLVGTWQTPPGRFFSTLMQLEIWPLLAFSTIILWVGLIIMGVEYFRKEDK
ncbi:peptidase M50 [Sporanaerobium hydrogeniformans]|uniref:Peptidase M50 n=1 Tax=Sporanaerobium hydrogeniformans TaxID=3072179 RepID=A0AC61DFP7_9FIRM|nr:peptidase M50 [Sporanaerobium hydrogeniformans]PHV72079.1 peptidase M50 [Sporanaerobium hydrogeniformans]